MQRKVRCESRIDNKSFYDPKVMHDLTISQLQREYFGPSRKLRNSIDLDRALWHRSSVDESRVMEELDSFSPGKRTIQ